ncbi:MAG: serine/threonine-protein phosphatase [Spirochaetales bacterium]|jgi:protein phosphatase|nr:serine/threonine-protein phosphatase [Spirochaetales bacterium]
MKFNIYAACDIGLKRKNNEDMILINNEFLRDQAREFLVSTKGKTAAVFAAADGMGGMERGEEASEQVLRSLASFVEPLPPGLNNEELDHVFKVFTSETHAKIPRDSGSTLAGLLAYEDRLYRFHAGDSRLYLYRKKGLSRLTIDHSLKEAGGQSGAPSNVITNSFGAGGTAFLEFAPLEPPRRGDAFLLSSDGLHDLVSSEEIEKHMGRGKQTVEKLIDLAKKYGGKDNISVVNIEVVEV